MHFAVRKRRPFVAVLHRSDPAQSLLVEVDAQRVETRDHHVDPQVEFLAVDEQRVGDISRNVHGVASPVDHWLAYSFPSPGTSRR